MPYLPPHLPVTSEADATRNFEQLAVLLAKPKWVPLTLEHVWKAYGSGTRTPSYTLNALGEVRLDGAVKEGESAKSVFTLPAGFRPGMTVIFPLIGPGQTMAELDITTGGVATITVASNTFVSLAGVTFLAEL